MATPKYNTYVGMRYVPIFDGEWDRTKTYEPLVIVSYQGNSYTSRTFVPTGIDINNTEYWALTGNYNAQVEYYRQETAEVRDRINYCVKGYNDVDAMIEDTDLIVGDICKTLGKNDYRDGKGGVYLITATAENGDYIELDNGLYAEKIIDINPVSFEAERIFRHIYYHDENGYTTYSAQGITSNGNKIITAGRVASDNSAQRISEFNINGTPIRTVTLTSADLGHCNDIAYNSENNKLYACGMSGKLCEINYSDFTISRVFATGLDGVAGVDCHNGTIYVYGTLNNEYTFGKINNDTDAYVEIGTFSVSSYITLQGMCVDDNYAYICANQNNKFIKLDINTAEIEDIIELDTGDGLYPYGELESATFINGQLYFVTSVWYTSFLGIDGAYFQVFKSNIGGIVFKKSRDGQGIGTGLGSTLYVDKNHTSYNPDGTSNNAFESLTEISTYTMYHANDIGRQTRIDVVAGQTFETQVLFLGGINAYIRMHACTCGSIQLKNGLYCIRQANCDVNVFCADVYVSHSTIGTYTHTSGKITFGVGNTINSYVLETCDVVTDNGHDLLAITNGNTGCTIHGSIAGEYTASTAFTYSGSGWVDDPFNLPMAKTNRIAYSYYNGTDGTIGIIWKRNDGKIHPDVSMTVPANTKFSINAIATI